MKQTPERIFCSARAEIRLHWSENKVGLALAAVFLVGCAAAIAAA